MYEKIAADGFSCLQLAYKKAIVGVKCYEDVTPELVEETRLAGEKTGIWTAVLGAYVELAMNDEAQREKNVADFISQLPVAKILGSACVGTETTDMKKQPVGTSRERALYLLCKSLDQILPEAERLGVNVGIEPVFCHSMCSPEVTRQVLDTMQSPNLKVIFDPANLISCEKAKQQDRVWQTTGELLGDRIVAVHFKGQSFHPDGSRFSTSLEDSVIDYRGAFDMLKDLPQRLPILREEAVPARALSDQNFMRKFWM